MKLAVCLLALAAVAFSQTTPEVTFNGVQDPFGNVGYPNRAYSMTKSGANFFGNFYVPASQRPTIPAGGVGCMKVFLKPDNPTSRTATMTVYSRPFTGAPSQAARATQQDNGFITMSTSTASQTLYTGTVPFTNNNGTGDGIALGGFLTGCTGCVRSADFVITAIFGATTGAATNCNGDVTWSPFPIIDSRATWVFDAPATGYQSGPSGGTFTLTNPTDIFLLSIPASSSTSVALAMTHTVTTPIPPKDQGINGQNDLWVSPFGTITRNGEVRSGRFPAIKAGTWWVYPFVNSGSSWSFAVGFGAEPAAAGMLVPSMLLAAILAVVAMLL